MFQLIKDKFNKFFDEINYPIHYENLPDNYNEETLGAIKSSLLQFKKFEHQLENIPNWESFCVKHNITGDEKDEDYNFETSNFRGTVWHNSQGEIFLDPQIDILNKKGEPIVEDFNVLEYENAIQLGGIDILKNNIVKDDLNDGLQI